MFLVISSAVDFTHEALRLLDAEPETAENADRLKDEKAHACLWLYICTLESNLQEVSAFYANRQTLTFDCISHGLNILICLKLFW